jgi:hypothetical protein
VRQLGRDQPFELLDEEMQALGWQIEAKQLDRNEAIVAGIVRSKDRTERSCSDLMENPERSERVGRRGAWCICMQWNGSSGRRFMVARLSAPVNKYSSRRARLVVCHVRNIGDLFPCRLAGTYAVYRVRAVRPAYTAVC